MRLGVGSVTCLGDLGAVCACAWPARRTSSAPSTLSQPSPWQHPRLLPAQHSGDGAAMFHRRTGGRRLCRVKCSTGISAICFDEHQRSSSMPSLLCCGCRWLDRPEAAPKPPAATEAQMDVRVHLVWPSVLVVAVPLLSVRRCGTGGNDDVVSGLALLCIGALVTPKVEDGAAAVRDTLSYKLLSASPGGAVTRPSALFAGEDVAGLVAESAYSALLTWLLLPFANPSAFLP